MTVSSRRNAYFFLHMQNFQYSFLQRQVMLQIFSSIHLCLSIREPRPLMAYSITLLLTFTKLILHKILQCAFQKNGAYLLLFCEF